MKRVGPALQDKKSQPRVSEGRKVYPSSFGRVFIRDQVELVDDGPGSLVFGLRWRRSPASNLGYSSRSSWNSIRIPDAFGFGLESECTILSQLLHDFLVLSSISPPLVKKKTEVPTFSSVLHL